MCVSVYSSIPSRLASLVKYVVRNGFEHSLHVGHRLLNCLHLRERWAWLGVGQGGGAYLAVEGTDGAVFVHHKSVITGIARPGRVVVRGRFHLIVRMWGCEGVGMVNSGRDLHVHLFPAHLHLGAGSIT